MKALITGGAGFIGSHLAEALLQQGNEVYVIDNLSTGSMENILHLKGQEGFHYNIDTIMNIPLMAELVDLCDVIYHLAAAVGVKLIVESPVYTIETNIKGTEVVLDLASKKSKKVIVASTSEVYGKGVKVPFAEGDDLLLGPTFRNRWSYACSKAIDEFLALAYCKERDLPTMVIRLFNTVGPRQSGQYGMVVPRFIQQALKNESLTVYGDGKQSRCFTWVGDVIDALIKLTFNEKAIGEIFNIGSTEEISIIDLAKLVIEVLQSKSEISFISYESAYEEGFEDMARRVPDISKVKKFIEFNPSQSIRNIIILTAEYYKQKYRER
ncbi:MAG: nucleoside-diphosphate sugar epimerase [Candidatus Fischerbacteria bacterium RBG_13_37_8]|uniref:UDP-glucuronate decarboxylase n=1 Tax=Candidatus Fischerbacteria bacterium RBG_13_37_8 TaxID=1817863 RepID=A0A1F5VW50_9BACT|nr:MAG: nucleoside-diphosphate sugar epimerase [Candidatus Fischerbacteria bacterium RBG_13_37_8]